MHGGMLDLDTFLFLLSSSLPAGQLKKTVKQALGTTKVLMEQAKGPLQSIWIAIACKTARVSYHTTSRDGEAGSGTSSHFFLMYTQHLIVMHFNACSFDNILHTILGTKED